MSVRSESQPVELQDLVAWATEHGAVLHPVLELYRDETAGNAFRVAQTAKIEPGETVVDCPIAITLSYLNTITGTADLVHHDGQATPFPVLFQTEVPAHVVGRFFLIQQYLLGKESFWWPYIRTLPQPEQLASWILPPLWPSDDLELLEDTNAQRATSDIKSQIKSDYKHAVSRLKSMPGWQDYTRVLYNWAYCIFTSRSFRPSLSIPDSASIQLPPGCAIDDFSILFPLLDVGNHSLTAKVAWDIPNGTKHCKLQTLDQYTSGEQVYNNYGGKTNAELMLAYGFLIPETEALHNDYVHVQKKSGERHEHNKQRDLLISLRPVNDPSSVAAKSGQIVLDIDASKILSAFTHVQDAMVWELVVALTTSEQREQLLPTSDSSSASDTEQLRHILTGSVAYAFRPILEQTIAIIQDKVLLELERLDSSEVELAEEDATKNQRLALQYRRQCRRVLENVLETLEMPDFSTETKRH